MPSAEVTLLDRQLAALTDVTNVRAGAPDAVPKPTSTHIYPHMTMAELAGVDTAMLRHRQTAGGRAAGGTKLAPKQAMLRSLKLAFMAAHFPNAPATRALPKASFNVPARVLAQLAGATTFDPAQQRRAALSAELQTEWETRERAKAQLRMQALKDNNADEYLKHLSTLKMASLLAIMEKTHQFMLDIGAQLESHASGSAPTAAANAANAAGGTDAGPEQPAADAGESEEYRKFKRYVSSTKDEYKLVHRVEAFVEAQPAALEATLMPHQIVGLRFLASLHANNINGILADEMGVGKTLQTLSFLTYLKEAGKVKGPHMVLAPLSIVREWAESAATFLPSLKVGRFDELEDKSAKGTRGFDLLLLAVHRARNFAAELQQTKWDFVVVDEAHKAVSNPNTQTAVAIYAIPFHSRLVLTGTPLNNDIQELWALLNFINPRVFGNRDSFEDVFRKPFAGTIASEKDVALDDEERQVLVLRMHQILRPFMLRRTKRDIDTSLRITFHNITCPLTAIQTHLIAQLRTERTLPAVLGGNKLGVRHVTGCEALVQGICNHPFNVPFFTQAMALAHPEAVAVVDSDTDDDSAASSDAEESSAGHGSKASSPAGHGDEPAKPKKSKRMSKAEAAGLLFPAPAALRSSGKFLVLFTILRRLRAIGRKAVVFSHFLDTIGLLQDSLDASELCGQYVVLTGATTADERKDYVHRFRDDPNTLLFVLSVKAGGCGLNLQVADVVILIDRDYTTTNEDQAIARVFRMGQRNTVRAIYLATTDKCEARVTEIADRKNRPRLAIIEAGAYNSEAPVDDADGQLEALRDTLSAEVEELDLSAMAATTDPSHAPTDAGEEDIPADAPAVAPPATTRWTPASLNAFVHERIDPLLCGGCDERLATLRAHDHDMFPAPITSIDELPTPIASALRESARIDKADADETANAGRGRRNGGTDDAWFCEAPDAYIEKWADEGLDADEIEEKYKQEQLAKMRRKEQKLLAACDVAFDNVSGAGIVAVAAKPTRAMTAAVAAGSLEVQPRGERRAKRTKRSSET